MIRAPLAMAFTINNMGHGDKTDILAEGRNGKAAKKTGQGTNKPVNGNGSSDFTI